MKRRDLAAVTVVATAAAVVPATAAFADPGNGKSVLHNSGVQRNITAADSFSVGGDASSSTRMQLALQLPLRNQAQAEKLAAAGVVLTPQQYAARFAPTKGQLTKLTKWAQKQGFTVTQVSSSSGQVFVNGTVAQVNSAFAVKMHTAKLNGVTGLAVDRDPSVPADLGLSGVAGLNSVTRMTTKGERQRGALAKAAAVTGGMKPAATTTGVKNCSTYWGQYLYPTAKKYSDQSNVMCGYTPKQLQTAYGATGYSAKAPVLGILLWGNATDTLANTNSYASSKGFPQLAAAKYKTVVAASNSRMSDCAPLDAGGEQALDVQSSHAIAPSASIQYYGAASCYDADLTPALQKMVDAHQVSTISMSFGSPSDAGMTAAQIAAWNRPLLQASLTGISTFASSGDDSDNSKMSGGDGRAHVGAPAANGYTTAVGGTSVGLNSAGAVSMTAAWENKYFVQSSASGTPTYRDITSQLGYDGGGGGVSASWAQPTWQKSKAGAYSTTKRVVPDVAGIANPLTGFTVRYRAYSYSSTGAVVSSSVVTEAWGGTSLASPVIAAVVGLAKNANNVKIGNAAPYFYKLAGTSAIKDVNYKGRAGVSAVTSNGTLLAIGVDDKPLSLASGPGYDNATGVGTPNGAAFYPAFK